MIYMGTAATEQTILAASFPDVSDCQYISSDVLIK